MPNTPWLQAHTRNNGLGTADTTAADLDGSVAGATDDLMTAWGEGDAADGAGEVVAKYWHGTC